MLLRWLLLLLLRCVCVCFTGCFRDDEPNMDSSQAKLADRITPRPTEPESAFSIKGLASKRAADQGFAIKGAGTSVKELFPEKFGNAGKELFAEKLDGRGRRRQRAEDTFR